MQILQFTIEPSSTHSIVAINNRLTKNLECESHSGEQESQGAIGFIKAEPKLATLDQNHFNNQPQRLSSQKNKNNAPNDRPHHHCRKNAGIGEKQIRNYQCS
jgi:hypothetical protein